RHGHGGIPPLFAAMGPAADDDALLLDDNRRSMFPGCNPRMISVSADHTMRRWDAKTGSSF
ncbi:unnamed protein product, partial [Effrenium voratum]